MMISRGTGQFALITVVLIVFFSLVVGCVSEDAGKNPSRTMNQSLSTSYFGMTAKLLESKIPVCISGVKESHKIVNDTRDALAKWVAPLQLLGNDIGEFVITISNGSCRSGALNLNFSTALKTCQREMAIGTTKADIRMNPSSTCANMLYIVGRTLGVADAAIERSAGATAACPTCGVTVSFKNMENIRRNFCQQFTLKTPKSVQGCQVDFRSSAEPASIPEVVKLWEKTVPGSTSASTSGSGGVVPPQTAPSNNQVSIAPPASSASPVSPTVLSLPIAIRNTGSGNEILLIVSPSQLVSSVEYCAGDDSQCSKGGAIKFTSFTVAKQSTGGTAHYARFANAPSTLIVRAKHNGLDYYRKISIVPR